MTLEASVPAPPAEPPVTAPRPAVERLITIGGLVVLVLATVFSALLELYWSPLRIGQVPIGVAILFAAVANYALCWFAEAAVGRRSAVAVPWVLWTVIMFFAAGFRTTEGDYLVGPEDWVALAMILVGSLTFAVYAYRAILRPTVTKS
ncbi:hypothetical protein [Actinoplanes sp. NPDC051859]|uniref:hypothetical protein n=1 Tax=Actinoplanes sp. NPDC051859 TaxID=3363909 RepID=UPI0037ABC0F2